MADFDLLCPTCHSRIGDIAEETLGIKQGELGTDEDGLPVPRWTDDPIRTSPRGFSGTEFIGADRAKGIHIRELQEVRALEEIEAGIDPELLTDFTEIDGNIVRVPHIVELRESVEKILEQNGSNLGEYFNLDADLNEAPPGPNDTIKVEWTDVDRGREYIHKDGTISGTFRLPGSTDEDDTTPSPTLPFNIAPRAIHIEDLRRTILSRLFFEYFSVSTDGFLFENDSPLPIATDVIRGVLFPTDLNIRSTADVDELQELIDSDFLTGPISNGAIEANKGWWRMLSVVTPETTSQNVFPPAVCPGGSTQFVDVTKKGTGTIEVTDGVTLPTGAKPSPQALTNKTVTMTSFSSSRAVGDFEALNPNLFGPGNNTPSFIPSQALNAMGIEAGVAPVEPLGQSSPVAEGSGGNSLFTLARLEDDVNFPLDKPTFELNDELIFKWHQEINLDVNVELVDYSFGATGGLGTIEDPIIRHASLNLMYLHMPRAVRTQSFNISTGENLLRSSTKDLNIRVRFFKTEAEKDEYLDILTPNAIKVEDGFTFVDGSVLEKTPIPLDFFGPIFPFGSTIFGEDFTLSPSLLFVEETDGPNYEIDFKKMLTAWLVALAQFTASEPNFSAEVVQSYYISEELAESTAEDLQPLSPTIATFSELKFWVSTEIDIALFQDSAGGVCNRVILGRARQGDISTSAKITGMRVEKREVVVP